MIFYILLLYIFFGFYFNDDFSETFYIWRKTNENKKDNNYNYAVFLISLNAILNYSSIRKSFI